MGKWARTALRKAKPEASKSLPAGDFGVVESVQCVELEGGGAGAEENDGGWGGVGKCGQSQEDLFVLYVEDGGRGAREEVGCVGDGDFDIAKYWRVVEVAQRHSQAC